MLVEVELDLLIGNVDAELFKRILFEVFKTKDVKNPNVQPFVISAEMYRICTLDSPALFGYFTSASTPQLLQKHNYYMFGLSRLGVSNWAGSPPV